MYKNETFHMAFQGISSLPYPTHTFDATDFFLGPLLGLVAQSFVRYWEPTSAYSFALFPASVGILAYTVFSRTILRSILTVCLFLLFLSFSILYYRLFSTSHPLHHIPGPILARATQLYQLHMIYVGQPRIKQQELHQRYGPVVRIGLNEVSICDADMLPVVFGAKSWEKGPSYSFIASSGSSASSTPLVALRDHEAHKFRRKIWDRAFSIASIRNYETFIVARVRQLLDQFDRIAQSNEIVDLQDWLRYLVFDVMTDLAWGGGAEADGGGDAIIKGRDPQGAIKSLRYSLHIAGFTKVIQWITGIIMRIPSIQRKTQQYRTFSQKMFEARKARGVSEKDALEGGTDVFYHLLGEGNKDGSGSKLSIGALNADSRLVVAAGADTTVSAMTNLFYYLLCSPTYYKKLQSILVALPKNDLYSGGLSPDDLARLPLLDAYINEALRLQPPAPYQNQRVVPAGGVMINAIFIPAGTATRTAVYALQRSPASFSDPDTFRPERWLADQRTEGEVFNPKAFMPFLTGPYHCVGRNFAMQEMRYAVAMVVARYDLVLAEGKDFNKQEFEEKIKDRSLLEIEGELNIRIVRRKG